MAFWTFTVPNRGQPHGLRVAKWPAVLPVLSGLISRDDQARDLLLFETSSAVVGRWQHSGLASAAFLPDSDSHMNLEDCDIHRFAAY